MNLISKLPEYSKDENLSCEDLTISMKNSYVEDTLEPFRSRKSSIKPEKYNSQVQIQNKENINGNRTTKRIQNYDRNYQK